MPTKGINKGLYFNHFKAKYKCCCCLVTKSCLILRDPMDCSLPMGFLRQEHWSRLLFPSPGYLPDPGTEPTSSVFPAFAGRFFIIAPPGKPQNTPL